jgi:hypothetical protein
MFGKVFAWWTAKDWRTWLSHVGMAAALGLAAWMVVPCAPWYAAYMLGVLAYWWREAEQVWEEYRTHGLDAVHAHALDHFGDIAVPFVVLGAVAYWG